MRRTIRPAAWRSSRGTVGVDEDRSLEPFADGQIDGAGDAWRQRHRDELAALAQHGQGAVPAFLAESFDVGADRFRHPQPVQRQQRHQGVIAWRGQAGGDQDGAELVAVEVGDVGLVVDPRSADVHRRGVLDDAFLFGVAVEPDDRAQPAGDGGAGLAAVFEVAGEALDVDAADVEQAGGRVASTKQ